MISRKQGSERRKHPRLANNIPIKISLDSGDVVTETANISRSGAYCCVPQFIEPMTKLKIQLLLSMRSKKGDVPKKVVCSGVVVRAEKAVKPNYFDIAIFFNDIAPKDAENISAYVSNHLETKVNS